MKQVVLLKQCNSIQLGHLYEHIFCMSTNELFYNNDLYMHLDYSLSGSTYSGGIIMIELDLYTDRAIAFAKNILDFEVPINTDSITTAAMQVQAEMESPFGGSGFDKIKHALEDLHSRPWQNIDDIEIYDEKSIQKQAYPLYITKGRELKSRKLTVDFVLDSAFAKENRELLPLFRQISLFSMANYRHVLSSHRSYYSPEDFFIESRNKIAWSVVYKVAFDQFDAVDLDRDISECRLVIQKLLDQAAFERYFKELQEISYYHQSQLALSLDAMYNDIGMIVGPKGWRKLATEENITKVLKHSYFEAKFGREKLSRRIM